MDHDGEIEGRRRLLRAPQRLEIVGPGDIVRQPRLDADDDVAVARDGALRQRDVGAVDVVQFAGRRDDAGPGDVDEAAADLRRAAGYGGDLIDVFGAPGAGVAPGGDAVLQAHRRTFLALAGMSVDVDQPRGDDLAARVDGFGR